MNSNFSSVCQIHSQSQPSFSEHSQRQRAHIQPSNSNLYYSSLMCISILPQFLRHSHIIQQLPVWREDLPQIIDTLQRHLPILSTNPAIAIISTSVAKNFGSRHQNLEDPWLILHMVLNILNLNAFTQLPQTSFSCWNTTYTYFQILQYTKPKFSHIPLLKSIVCPRCRESKPPDVVFKPICFLLRIENYLRNSHFDKVSMSSSIIKFNSYQCFFSTLVFSRGKITCLDNNLKINHSHTQILLDRKEWQTYIVNYQLSANRQEPISKPLPEHQQLDFTVTRHLVGSSSRQNGFDPNKPFNHKQTFSAIKDRVRYFADCIRKQHIERLNIFKEQAQDVSSFLQSTTQFLTGTTHKMIKDWLFLEKNCKDLKILLKLSNNKINNYASITNNVLQSVENLSLILDYLVEKRRFKAINIRTSFLPNVELPKSPKPELHPPLVIRQRQNKFGEQISQLPYQNFTAN